MARKVLTHEVKNDSGNRDAGKVFVITEMSATEAQRWAMRAFLALASNGVELPDDVEGLGIAGMVHHGMDMIGKLPFEEADFLVGRLMACVQIQPSPGVVRPLIESDIEEVTTRFVLAKEAFRLHVNFSQLASNSTQAHGASASTTAG